MAYVQFANAADASHVVDGTDGRAPEILVGDYAVSFEHVATPLHQHDDGDWICNNVSKSE